MLVSKLYRYYMQILGNFALSLQLH